MLFRVVVSSILSCTLMLTAFAQEGPGGVRGDASNRYWFDANTLTLSDGDAVSSWQNFGGNGTAADQSSNPRQPTFQSDVLSAINGYPVLRFDGNNDFFDIPNSSDLNTSATYNRTYWLVLRTGADVLSRQVLYEEGGTVRGLNSYIFNGNIYVGAWNLNNDGVDAPWGFSQVNTAVLPNTTYILGFVMQGNVTTTGSIQAYLNGQNFGTINNVGQLYAHTGAIGLGAKNSATVYETGTSNGNGDYFGGDIAEFIQYTLSINQSEIELINNYLSAKYNIALLSGDQYNMDSPLNGDYDHEVAGIGQASDGSSSLDGQGPSILRINNASNLDNSEFLIFGHDNASLTEIAAGIPTTVDYRTDRVWRFDEQGEVGTVTLELDISSVFLSGNAAVDYVLLVDNTDTDFSDAAIYNATSLNSGVLTFSGIDIEAGDHVCLGISSSFTGNQGPGGVLSDDRYRFWFKADQINLSDDASVATWNNDGGNSNDAFQNTASSRPTFQNDVSSTLNGYPVVRFDGSNDFLSIPDNTDLNTAASSFRTFFMTFRTGSNVNTRQVLYEEGGNTRGLNIYISSGNLYVGGWNYGNDGAGAPWIFQSINTPVSANTAYNISVVYTGNNDFTGTIELYVNGSLVGSANNVGRLYPHGADIGIGAKNNDTYYENGSSSGTGQYFGGDIAEFIIYNFPLNSTFRVIVENYLSAKYGISQSNNDVYTMDDVANGDFDHDMAGIGRQTSSISHTDAKGPGMIRVYNPSSLDDGDYLLWGHNDEETCNSSDVPASLNSRLLRTWRCSETADVGTVNISVDMSAIAYGSASGIRLLVDGDGAFGDATVIAPNSISSDVFEFNGINLSDGQYFTIGSSDLLVDLYTDTTRWNGSSADWFSDGNWSHGVPDSNMNVVIPTGVSNFPVITANTRCKNIEIESGASLEITASNTLEVFGSWSNEGTFTENTSTLHFKGDCGRAAFINNGAERFHNIIIENPNGSQIVRGTVEIAGYLDLRLGAFLTNDSLTLISDANGTARIVEITGGSISGNIEMQRYIDAGATNWRFLTFAVSGADLEQFDDDFITSGIPGSDYPNWPSASNPWPSLYTYDEAAGFTFDQGFLPVSNMSNVLGTGQGLWIWCGDTITGTQPFTIDVRGPANTGSINLPVSFTPTSGNMDNDGWNMVANPYPCTIDWDSPNWTKTNIENAVYVWNPDLQQYATYIAGAATNGGSNLIASSQAFMVHADAAFPTLTIEESCKVNQDQAFLKASSISTDLLRIKVFDGTYQDETVVRFDQLAHNSFDAYADARKNLSGITSVPRLFTTHDGTDYAINTLNADTLVSSLPLNYKAIANGTHSIEIIDRAAIDQFSCVLLEDTFEDTWTNLLVDSVYQFTANINDPLNRFVIHFSKGVKLNETNPLCDDDSTGSIQMDQFIQNSVVEVFHSGTTVFSDTVNHLTNLQNLSAGQYQITVTTVSGLCPVENHTVVLTNPAPVVSDEVVFHETCVSCCDGSIDVSISGGSAPYSIMWTDPALSGFSMNGVCAGIYTYDVTDSNGCESSHSVQIGGLTGIDETESLIQIYPNPSDGQFYVETEVPADLKIVDARGRMIWSGSNLNPKEFIDLGHVENGLYYLILISGDKTETRSMIIK